MMLMTMVILCPLFLINLEVISATVNKTPTVNETMSKLKNKITDSKKKTATDKKTSDNPGIDGVNGYNCA